MEIERKYLLSARPENLEQHPFARIEQGYVAVDPAGVEVRLRRTGDQRLITVKGGRGLVRTEQEWAIEPQRFDALWALTDGRRVVKTRYALPLAGGLTAEVDVYAGPLAGLLTAEVEFSGEAEADAFAPPAWLGREITGDDRYANRSLAVDGLPA